MHRLVARVEALAVVWTVATVGGREQASMAAAVTVELDQGG